MSEITLVTAFFDINRDTWAKFFRTAKDYLKHFDHWARMRNRLIVYTMPEIVEYYAVSEPPNTRVGATRYAI